MRGRTSTANKRRQDLPDGSSGKRSRLNFEGSGGTFHVDINVEDVVVQATGSGQPSADVGLASANHYTFVLKGYDKIILYFRCSLTKPSGHDGSCR